MNSVLLFDFEDSFTQNIASEIYFHHKDIKTIHYSQFDQVIHDLPYDQKTAIILGPGPGHPDQYQKYLTKLKKAFENPNWMVLGICLGHQIALSQLGHELSRCAFPIHGQSKKIQIPAWPIFDRNDWGKIVDIQFYNSLAVKFAGHSFEDYFVLSNEASEALIAYFPNKQLLSYQFHPESLGTSYPKVFFAPLLSFLYN